MLISEKMKKGFTITELMVAVAILAITMAGVSTIFKISITAYRTSSATAEVMRNLRAITDQLDADFKSIRKNALLAIWFEKDDVVDVRYDQIVFFANGDFQSVRADYEYQKSGGGIGTKSVRGNVGRLYYGQASDFNMLARKQKLLTADDTLVADTEPNDPTEYERRALALIKVAPLTANELDAWMERPDITTLNPPQNLHMLMTNGFADFKIQIWIQVSPGTREPWFPSSDPDGDGDKSDSDFVTIGREEFGLLLNVPPGSTIGDEWFLLTDCPEALKFTFTLYDSRGVLEKGTTFTHIVYIED